MQFFESFEKNCETAKAIRPDIAGNHGCIRCCSDCPRNVMSTAKGTNNAFH